MAFFQIEAANHLVPVAPTTFQLLGYKERQDMQAMLRDHAAAIDHDILIVAEEFGNWEDSSRRVDLLAIDKSANLVVIELKRVAEGSHMELQALRYAAMLSTVDFPQVRGRLRQIAQATGTNTGRSGATAAGLSGIVNC